MNEKKQGGTKIFYYLTVALLVVLVFALLFVDFGNNGKKLDGAQVKDIISGEYVGEENAKLNASFVYYKNGKGYILIENSKYKANQLPNYSDFYFDYDASGADGFIEEIRVLCDSKNVAYTYAPTGFNVWNLVIPILYVGFAIFMFFMMFKMISGANKGAMTFGKTKVKSYSITKVKFTDIAGMDEEKAELQEIVEFLKNPKKFTDLGARIPKGVLLVGQPGTGKTLLARAVAGESRVPFISISGSDFVEMFVGVGASRVRDLFDQAKKNKPCIVFIDEIDAVGRQRGAGLGGGNDEREQTLNQLLVEMDGFELNEGIIVLAATNRSDVLDPALLRPGRFDRQVYVHVPDVKGREGILRIHARNKPLDESIDFSVLARITSGFTGADIENMLNEAAILAARAGRTRIIMEDITEGINKVIMGPQKKSKLITEKERELTAYHEAGHTIIAKSLAYCEDVQEVSIIPRGNAGGYTMSRPEKDDTTISFNKANDTIAMAMGGRIAEELIFRDITSGASADIQHATKVAKAMVYDWGMSKKIGFLSLGASSMVFIGRDYQTKNEFSEKLAGVADDEIMSILNNNYKRAKEVMTEKLDVLHEMAKLLMERETIYKEEVDMIMQGKKSDEVVVLMNEREKVRKEREHKLKLEKDRLEKLEVFKRKIAEGENLVKMGIITAEELDKIKQDYQIFKESVDKVVEIENQEDDKVELNNKEEAKQKDIKEVEKDSSKPAEKKASSQSKKTSSTKQSSKNTDNKDKKNGEED